MDLFGSLSEDQWREIKIVCKDLGLTSRKLAEKIGITPGSYSNKLRQVEGRHFTRKEAMEIYEVTGRDVRLNFLENYDPSINEEIKEKAKGDRVWVDLFSDYFNRLKPIYLSGDSSERLKLLGRLEDLVVEFEKKES